MSADSEGGSHSRGGELKQLDKTREYLRQVYNRKIQQDYDRVVLVIGDEGAGKSTLMLQCMWMWEQVRENEPTPDSVIDRVVFGERDEYKEMLLNSESGDPISVQDAAHVLFSKDAMVGDQKDIEKAMLDMRIENYFVLLGFQDWRDIPDALRRRRAKNVLRVPERGTIIGYSRDSMDEKYDNPNDGWWPEPDFEDEFPSLEGTELWDRFNERDAEAKRERLQDSKDISTEDAQKEEQIKIALRAVKPWADDRGMTQADAASLTDYSQSWVSDKVSNWEKGEYRDLVDENDDANRVTRKGLE